MNRTRLAVVIVIRGRLARLARALRRLDRTPITLPASAVRYLRDQCFLGTSGRDSGVVPPHPCAAGYRAAEWYEWNTCRDKAAEHAARRYLGLD